MDASPRRIVATLAVALAATFAGLFGGCGQPLPASAPPLSEAEQEALSVCEGGPTVYGIDISNNNGSNFNLGASKANGVRFVYLKASQGDYFTDDTYAGYRQKAEGLGLIHGAYHFFDPQSDPNKAADLFLRIIGSAPKGDLPPALDWEITSGVAWDTAFARAKIFLNRVESATGRTPMIYTYPDFFGQRVPSEFAKYPLWISNPGSTCPLMPDGPWDHFTIFQYNTSGLDHDHFIGDLAQLQGFDGQSSSSGGGGSSAPPSAPPDFTQSCTNAGVGNEGVLSGCDEQAIRAIAPASAKTFLDRAFAWVGRVWYSQSSYTDGYRQDCSGFVSYVWNIGTSDTTYSLAGGPWNNDLSTRISWSQLTPGDAINFPGDWQAGTGHVELWGGWLNRQHTEYCAIEEFDYGYTASIRPHSIYEYWAEAGAYADVDKIFLPIRKKGYDPTTTTCETLATPVDQIENNGGLTAATWADGHVEVFARSNSGRVVHAWTDGAANQWHAAEDLQGTAECGVASVISFAGSEHAEVFDSSAQGGDTRATDYNDGWKSLSDFGGRNLVQVSTLRWNDEKSGGWNDGRTEVFGLAAGDHQIYHKYFDPFDKRWSGWESLGGALATGVSPILDKSGDALLFATDAHGQAWYNESDRPTGGGWKGWKHIGGGTLSSRPVAVRDPNGELRLFARGQDGKLYGSTSNRDGFSHFELLESDFDLAGEPAVAVDDGYVEVFVRGLSNKVSRATLDPKTHKLGRFERMSEDEFSSDPFAWARTDGFVDVFAVTTNGHLGVSYHSRAGWKPFERIATGVDACVTPQLTPECPNGVNGSYCGGHGIGGSSGTLYACNDGKVTELQACSLGCLETGNGGSDECKSSGGVDGGGVCVTDSDCQADFPGGVCVQANPCGQQNFCAYPQAGQLCSSNADCGTLSCSVSSGCGTCS
ncbi:MAG: GH25 family lysozyme [Myxococcales bacterium]